MKDFERTTRSLFTQCRKACGAFAIVTAVSMSVVPTMAYAGSAVGTTILSVLAITANIMLVYPAAAITGSPGCATVTNAFAISASDKYLVAGVLSAQASGKTVDLYGTGVCGNWPNTENFGFLMIH